MWSLSSLQTGQAGGREMHLPRGVCRLHARLGRSAPEDLCVSLAYVHVLRAHTFACRLCPSVGVQASLRVVQV